MLSLEERVGNDIVSYIRNDFTRNHLSGNTSMLVRCRRLNYYTCVVIVDPPVYNQNLFLKKRRMVYNYGYSYAENVNQVGGEIYRHKTNNHKNYVKKSLRYAFKKNYLRVKGGTFSTIKGHYNRKIYKNITYKE